MSNSLDYNRWIHLDAERLAEGGICEAYHLLLPELRQYVQQEVQIEESINEDTPRYSVQCGAREFIIYGPEVDGKGGDSWGRATVALFTIINDQLLNSEYRFYAINGGNDLGGMFLTPAQAEEAQQALPTKRDWPYLPQDGPPWYGQYH